MTPRMCKNGCDAECYTARLVCKRCVADESLARKRSRSDEPVKRGRPKKADGNVQRLARIESTPLEGFNSIMGRMASVSLRVSA